MKQYIHEVFNPKTHTASNVITEATKQFHQIVFEKVIYINDYEAVCIFSQGEDV